MSAETLCKECDHALTHHRGGKCYGGRGGRPVCHCTQTRDDIRRQPAVPPSDSGAPTERELNNDLIARIDRGFETPPAPTDANYVQVVEGSFRAHPFDAEDRGVLARWAEKIQNGCGDLRVTHDKSQHAITVLRYEATLASLSSLQAETAAELERLKAAAQNAACAGRKQVDDDLAEYGYNSMEFATSRGAWHATIGPLRPFIDLKQCLPSTDPRP